MTIHRMYGRTIWVYRFDLEHIYISNFQWQLPLHWANESMKKNLFLVWSRALDWTWRTSDETIVCCWKAAMLIINDKIYNRKWLTSLNTNKFRFTSIYSICFPSWNLIYGVWYSIIYSNLLIASLLMISMQHFYFMKARGTSSSGKERLK